MSSGREQAGTTRVGAPYWEHGSYDRALALAVADGLIVRGEGGILQASVERA